MTEYREQVADLVRAVSFRPSGAPTWLGRPVGPASRGAGLSPDDLRALRLQQLQTQLYVAFYCKGGVTAGEAEPGSEPHPDGSPALVAALSAANAGAGCLEGDWTLVGTEGSYAALRKNGLTLWVETADLSQTPGGVAVRLPKEQLAISPGFYLALGDRGRAADEAQLLRLYWNLAPQGAVRFMALATGRLNQAALPFSLKALNDPVSYARSDTVVLYARSCDYDRLGTILTEIYAQVRPSLRSGRPALTKRLAPGVGLAEEPEGGDSFGMHRCRLLAEGLLHAHEQGRTGLQARIDAVADRFTAAGLSLDQPYLNRGASDRYPPLRVAAPVEARPHPAPSADQAPSPEAHLREAAGLGELLAREAICHEGRATWLGSPSAGPGASAGRTWSPLGPDLYEGSSGVGLFLAELSAATGDKASRQLALAAVRQAFATAEQVDPRHRFGLHSGWMGIAWAAVRSGSILRAEEPVADARALLNRLARAARTGPEHDLMAGSAGAVVALLALRGALADDSLLDWAADLGDHLVSSAVPGRGGLSWPSESAPSPHNLTGFAHGTAGIAYALLQLYQATGDERFRLAAEGGAAYERSWFDPHQENWPDFHTKPRGRGHGAWPCMTSWCHGAPGIALSRLAGWAILGEERWKEEAVTALATTARSVEEGLSSGWGSMSLCHGLPGNAEVLRRGQAVLGQEAPGRRSLAVEVASLSLSGGLPGDRGGPGLMLGTAGLGLFNLRLYDPTIPSPLWLE